jgi:plastocyanin
MKKAFLFGAIVFLSIALVSCKSDDPPAPTDTTTNVNILVMSFNPDPVTVKKGVIVKWINTDTAPHNVTSNDGVTFASPDIPPGESYSYTTTTVGAFAYHCTIHGIIMSGTLNVTN